MSTEIARIGPGATQLSAEQQGAAAEAVEALVMNGDLSKLTPLQRVSYHAMICARHHLDPYAKPFEFLLLDGKLTMYPTKRCAEMLRYNHRISVKKVREERVGDLWCVEVEGRRPSGQTDFATKYVPLYTIERDGSKRSLAGNKLGDAMAKCETGAKRRLTFSMVALGGTEGQYDDEQPGGRHVILDADGEIVEHPTEEQRYLDRVPAAGKVMGVRTLADADPAASPVQSPERAPTPEELAPPQRPAGERPSFRPSEETVKRRLGAWFAAVKGTSLDDDEARHRFVEQWTASYVPGLRTDSLRAFFEHATDRQAGDLIAHVRAIVDDERRVEAEAQLPDDERPF